MSGGKAEGVWAQIEEGQRMIIAETPVPDNAPDEP
jgi:hypothetical protein